MTEALLVTMSSVAVAACLLYRRERARRLFSEANCDARLSVAFSGLREYQQANDTLRFELSRRERAIGNLTRRLNEATIAHIEAGQRAACLPLALGLPHLKVAPSQFNRN